MPQRGRGINHVIKKMDINEGASTSSSSENSDESDPNAAEVVLSNKGGPKLIHQNYMYTLHKKQPFNIRWRCVHRTKQCRGSVVTTTTCTRPKVRMVHNHMPDIPAAQYARQRFLELGKPCVLKMIEGTPRTTFRSMSAAPQRATKKETKEVEDRRPLTRATARTPCKCVNKLLSVDRCTVIFIK